MSLNQEDVSVLRAARAASPERFRSFDPNNSLDKRYGPDHPQRSHERTTSSATTASFSPRESIEVQSIRGGTAYQPLSRTQTETERINKLESHPTALDRIETHRSQHSTTVGSLRSRKTTKELPKFGAGKPYPPNLPEQEEYVVEFDGPDDPMHAQNWTMKKKLWIGGILAFDSLAATFGSSVFSSATLVVSAQFGVGSEVGTLATSFYVLGYAFGPIIWAPFSELYGRKPPILVGAFGFAIFSVAIAVAKDLQTILICRFFSGLFGSCPLAVVAAVFTDMFNNAQRGIAVAIFAATVFMGPLLAPFIGGFITISYLGWRWTEYITAIMGFLAFGLAFLFQEESYPPVILVSKASELRRRTKNWGIHAKQEEVEVDLRELLTKNISRPLRILFTEPIVLLITIYMSFIYGLLYLFLTAYALVFQGVYGMNPGVGGLPYFGMIAGEILAFIAVVLMQPAYVRKLEANSNIPVPEWRLPVSIAGGVTFAIGLFWFGWSGYKPDVHWIVPTLSGLFTGFGIFSIFLQLLNYIVDAYLMFAASAIAGNTFLRSLFAAVFPLFARQMFDGMGIQWASTLLGCVALVMVPMPIVFLMYGRRIRGRSKMAPALDLKLDAKRKAAEDAEAGTATGGDVVATASRQETNKSKVNEKEKLSPVASRSAESESEEREEVEEAEEVEEDRSGKRKEL